MTIIKKVQEFKQQLTVAELFAIKYGPKLPEDVGNFSISSGLVQFSYDATYDIDENRDRILTLFGDVFGRSNWTSKLSYYGRHFDWKKELDGVEIRIDGARKVSQPEAFPVDPKEFPIQLEDREEPEPPAFKGPVRDTVAEEIL